MSAETSGGEQGRRQGLAGALLRPAALLLPAALAVLAALGACAGDAGEDGEDAVEEVSVAAPQAPDTTDDARERRMKSLAADDEVEGASKPPDADEERPEEDG